MAANRDGFKDLGEAPDAVAAYNPTRPRPSDPSGLARNLRLRENGRWPRRAGHDRPSMVRAMSVRITSLVPAMIDQARLLR